MISTITLDTYKQQISSGDAFNLSDSFNGRVGDEQVPLVVHFKERGLAQQFQDGLAPFLTGFVGSLDENDQVTAETGEAVSYVGTSDDIVGLGRVKMNLPGTMFPQEGYFYGFLGLQNADGKRVTTFNIWFHVYNGNPDMFVNKAPFRTELQKLLDESEQLISKTDGVIQAKLIEWQNAINKLITDGNTDLDTYKQRVSLAEDQLNGLTAKIAANDIPTKADLNKTIADLTGRLDDLDDQFTLNPVNPWMTAVSPDIEAQLSSYETTINKADGVVRILN
ncbi:MAG: capsid protein, partial [Lactiplantibacillus plantarum]|nr:capsid protein [Lactiplantibacillus plantarum]